MKAHTRFLPVGLILALGCSCFVAGAQQMTGGKRVAYEEDYDAAEELLTQPGYVRLADGAAGLQSAPWQALMGMLDQQAPYRDQIPGGAIYFGARATPSGQRVLVYATYRLHGDLPGRGALELWLIGVNSSGQLRDMGHYVYDDFLLFCYWTRPPVKQPWPHPEKHTLRIYTAQVDSTDQSSFAFDYQLDRQAGRLTVQILDGESDSTSPSQPRVKVTAVK